MKFLMISYLTVVAGGSAATTTTFTVTETYNFIDDYSVNPIGLGNALTGSPFYAGGIFDTFGIEVSPVCTGGTPACTTGLTPPPYPPGSTITQVVATQGSLQFNVPFLNSPAVPTDFAQHVQFPAGTIPPGPWNLTVTNAGVSNSPLVTATPSLATTTPPAFVTGIAVTGGVTPTLTWANPPGAGTATEEIQINDLNNSNEIIFNSPALPGTTTSYTIPATASLQANGNYTLAIIVANNNSSGTLLARSRLYTAPFSPLPATVTAPAFLPVISPSAAGSGFAYKFDVPVSANQPILLDPAVAVGFIYQIGAGDPNFASVELPDIGNPNPYDLYLWNGTSFVFDTTIDPNTLFDFAAAGVGEFEILGIAPSVALDPSNSTDFVTQLTFTGSGSFTGTMTPITEEVAAVPEPGSIVLLASGLLGLLLLRRRAASGHCGGA